MIFSGSERELVSRDNNKNAIVKHVPRNKDRLISGRYLIRNCVVLLDTSRWCRRKRNLRGFFSIYEKLDLRSTTSVESLTHVAATRKKKTEVVRPTCSKFGGRTAAGTYRPSHKSSQLKHTSCVYSHDYLVFSWEIFSASDFPQSFQCIKIKSLLKKVSGCSRCYIVDCESCCYPWSLFIIRQASWKEQSLQYCVIKLKSLWR